MARTICTAFILMMAGALVQANQCSSGGECLSADVSKSVMSLIQSNLHVDILKHGGEDDSKGDPKQEAKQSLRVAETVAEDEAATAQQNFLSVLKQIMTEMWQQQPDVAATAEADPFTLAAEGSAPLNKAVTVRVPGFEMAWGIITFLLVISIIVFLYWRLGVLVIVKVLTYLLALSTIKATVKVVVGGNSFNFPLFLTTVHFGSCGIFAFTLLLYNSWSNNVEFERPSRQVFGTRFCAIAVAFATYVSMSNMALVSSTTAFCEIIEASYPVVTVLMTLAMQKPFDVRLLAPCLVVCVGCALTVDGEQHFSMRGLILAAGSGLPHAFKSILQAEVLCEQDADAKVYSPTAVLAWTCLPSTIVMLIWSFFQEGTMPYQQIYGQGFSSQLTMAIFLSTVNAWILNLSILFVVKSLGAVGTQMVAQTKSMLVVLGGIFLLKEQVSRKVFVGYFVVMGGVYAYNYLDSKLRVAKEEDAVAATFLWKSQAASLTRRSSARAGGCLTDESIRPRSETVG